MMKFYTVKGGGRLTSCVGPSLWLLEETGKAYEVIEIDLPKGENKTEAFLKINPNGKIPCFNDNGFVIWESPAINYYIAEKYKPEFLGSTIYEKAMVNQWMAWAISELQPYVSEIFINAMKMPEQRDYNQIQLAKHRIIHYTVILDKYLKDKKFLVADKLSLADLHLASFIHVLSIFHIDITLYTNFRKWYQYLMHRETLANLEKKNLLILSK